MPTEVMTARTAPPAITPVPSGAGFSSTWPEPNRPSTRWGIEFCVRLTLSRFFFADSNPLADRLRDFLGLARPVADHGRAGIAHYHQRRKRQVLAALDHLGDAVDGDHLVFQLIVAGIELFRYCWHSNPNQSVIS